MIIGWVLGLAITLTPVEREARFEGALLTGRVEQIEKELADLTLRRPTLTGAYAAAAIGGSFVVLALAVIPISLIAFGGIGLGSGIFVGVAGLLGLVGLVVGIIGLAIIPLTLSDQRVIDQRAASLKEELDRLKQQQTLLSTPMVELATF